MLSLSKAAFETMGSSPWKFQLFIGSLGVQNGHWNGLVSHLRHRNPPPFWRIKWELIFHYWKKYFVFCYYKERSRLRALWKGFPIVWYLMWAACDYCWSTKNIVNLIKESPEGRIEHLPCPRFSRGADVKKKQDLLEGKLKWCITGNTISLLFAWALVQEQQCVWVVDLQSVCWLWFLLQFPRRSTQREEAQVQRETFPIQPASRAPMLPLNRNAWI